MIEMKAINVVSDKKLLDGVLPPLLEDLLTPEELETELEKGDQSIERGDCYTQEEMRLIMEREFKSS